MNWADRNWNGILRLARGTGIAIIGAAMILSVFTLSLVILTDNIHNQKAVLLSAQTIQYAFLASFCGIVLVAMGTFLPKDEALSYSKPPEEKT